LIGVAGDPVQVRNHDDAGVCTATGAFMRELGLSACQSRTSRR
jgi:hypothetical protein